MTKYAIVLSGGGSKGAYEVGVWKALRKMWISYDIVTGTSVGALNGMLMVQRDYKKCLEIWQNIQFADLFTEEFPGKHSTIKEKAVIYKKYANGFIKEGGMDVSPLEKLIEATYDEEKFFGSPISYGLIAYNLTKLKPVCLTKETMPRELVRDYVIASATCFPAFKTKIIEGEKYIDGGYYDNLPLNLAVKMGAKAIIAVDLDEVGIKRKLRNSKIPVIRITPRNNLGSFLIFDKEHAKRAIQLGYNDTMKTFHRLDGDLFTFKRHHMYRNIQKYETKFVSLAQNLLVSPQRSLLDRLFQSADLKDLAGQKNIRDIFKRTMEYTGQLLSLEESHIYDYRNYNQTLRTKIKEIPSIKLPTLMEKGKIRKVKDIVHLKNIVKYFYDSFQKKSTEKEKRELLNIAILFPREFLSAIYLTILDV